MAPLLLLVRHGKAEKSHPAGDAARPLSNDGRHDFRKHVRELLHLCRLKGIVTSPLVRAVQTAEILASGFDLEEVKVSKLLAPVGVRPADRIISVAQQFGGGHALVGHNPSLTLAATKMMGLRELPFSFKKGAAIAFEVDGKAFQFAWYHTPGGDLVKHLPK